VLEAFFKAEQPEQQEVLIPTRATQSGWGQGQLRGMAVSGALARGTEKAISELPVDDLRPSRFTLDLFRPARTLPSTVRTAVVRQGRRLVLVDAFFEQDGKAVARSATLFLSPSSAPVGDVWSQTPELEFPPADLVPDDNDERIYFEEGRGWCTSVGTNHGALRRQSWHFPTPVVEGEEPTAFQMAGSVCDVTNVVANWGEQGLEFINADVTLTMVREPQDAHVGLSASSRVEADGLSVGSAMLYDSQGVFGISLVTALANPESPTNPKTRKPMGS
jgi:hypothetical protein